MDQRASGTRAYSTTAAGCDDAAVYCQIGVERRLQPQITTEARHGDRSNPAAATRLASVASASTTEQCRGGTDASGSHVA